MPGGKWSYCRPRLTVVSTQAQLAGPLAAIFLHLPGLRLAAVQGAPLWQTAPPGLVAHGPSATKPARCSNPGKPVSCEQVPPYEMAVKTVEVKQTATTSIRDAKRAVDFMRW